MKNEKTMIPWFCFIFMSIRFSLIHFLPGDGIDFVSVGEVFDNDFLHSWFYHNIPEGGKLWLGMTFNAPADTSEVDFVWANKYPVFYTNWAPSNPSHNAISTGSGCVYMDK